ncbi:hypothetical protein [Hyphomicrobium sp. DY-1]|uniref:hypothetical protein n=1 Tax=Hyphomicrobium sp. DY-1 TaxID=3075650 RepID=UPI0039C0A00A
MAVTNQLSTQKANAAASPKVMNPAGDEGGKLRIARFNFVQAGAGDATSTVDLVDLPRGRVNIVTALSKVAWSAFGSARTLDIGLRAYTKIDNSVNAEAPAELDDDIDVSSAGTAAPGSDLSSKDKIRTVTSQQGVTVFASVAGGTIPDGATLDGYIVYTTD